MKKSNLINLCLAGLLSVPIVLPNGNVLVPVPNVPQNPPQYQPDFQTFPQNQPEFQGNYIDPSNGNVYVPIAPNAVIDTETGKTYP